MGSSLHVYNQLSQGYFFWTNPSAEWGSLPHGSEWSKGELKFTGANCLLLFPNLITLWLQLVNIEEVVVEVQITN